MEIEKIKKGRLVDKKTQIILFAKAAGRCELCNTFLVTDKIILVDLILAEMAHIYAFGKRGPRADLRKKHLNEAGNLMLLCSKCHTRIDKGELVKYYSASQLFEFKKQHEKRIKRVTSIKESRISKVLKMTMNINREVVKLSTEEMVKALLGEKRYSFDENPCEIDFTNTTGVNNKVYWESKKQEIDELVADFYSEVKRDKISHVSIFAIGPIPLLMYLGTQMENKINTTIFQRHRDGEDWNWKKGPVTTKFVLKTVQKGKDKNKVALLLSMSGVVVRSLLPNKINEDYYIYELILVPDPNYNFLRTEKDLHNFEKEYSTAISKIKNHHNGLKIIDVMPAVPAPVAVICGRALNKNSDPKLKIYNTVNKSKFKYALTIN